MTSSANDATRIMSCLSQGMIDKLHYACQAYIKELLILKKDEEEKGNVKQYRWLNIAEYRYRSNPIRTLIDEMFSSRINTPQLRVSVISDYFAPEDEDILKRFLNNYYIHVYKFTPKRFEEESLNNPSEYLPSEYLNIICELAMYFYMELNENFVIENLHIVDTNDNQLK
jgi:hypothetical protein